MMRVSILIIKNALCLCLLPGGAAAFSVTSPSPTTSTVTGTANAGIAKQDMFEYLKWSGATPDFDPLAKTIEYTGMLEKGTSAPEEWYDQDYCLRGAVIGPLTRKDLRETQTGFGIRDAFSDLQITNFGHTLDPENPYRVFYFQRWRATHTGTLKAGPQEFPATGNRMEGPVWVSSVVWTPKQTIIYEQVGATVDRLEGNTQGKAAVFGLLHTAGVKIGAAPGSALLRFQQRLGHVLGFGRSFSREEDIPAWWTDSSRGADGTPQKE
jgi:hypothetical protein